MSITVLVDGVPILCESATDAVAVAREAAKSGAVVGGTGGGTTKANGDRGDALSGSRWTEQRVREFFRVIKSQQRKLVDTLLDSDDAVTDTMLCQQLGLSDGRSLAGVFTGLWKNAKKVGADPKDLYLRNNANIGGERKFEYTLTDSFRVAARKWK